jgi:hypothetical protein
MVPLIYDGLLALWTLVTGAQTGTTYNVDPPSNGPSDQLEYSIQLTAGTATWVLEGQNSPNDAFVQIDTGSASKTALCGTYRIIRIRLTAATGATLRASVNRVLRP